MKYLSFWVLPIISGVVWLGTLMGLLIHWVVNTNRVRYASMNNGQVVAYISDVGASELKPLFVAGCIITTLFLDLSFGVDRWLRHKGRLVPHTSRGEKILSTLTLVFAFIGMVGLCCLSGFDTLRYPLLHNCFLLLFIVGYLFSAIFICWEYQRLGIKNRDHRVLRISFWIKLVFVILELILAIAFVVTNFLRMYNSAAIIEWSIGFLFSLYVFSFFVDLYPAVRTQNGVGFRTRGMNNSPQHMEENSYSSQAGPIPRYTEDSDRPPSGKAHHKKWLAGF